MKVRSGMQPSKRGGKVTSSMHSRPFLTSCLCFVVLIIAIIITISPTATDVTGQLDRIEKQPTQPYTINSLVITLMPDGQSEVQYDISVDPRKQETNVKLFGQTRNLTARDLSSNNSIETSFSEDLHNVTLVSLGATNVKIRYDTPDLTQKNGRIWSFSLNSPTRFSVILPLNSIVTDWGKQNPILIKRAGEQNLITFDAGNVQLRYMTEFPSSNNRADVIINSAETTIKDIKQRYPGIVLTDSEKILQNAISSKSNKRPVDAELFATRANDLSLEMVKKYTAALTIIEQANVELNKTSNEGDNDNAPSLILLSQAKELFSKGDYIRAIQFAQKAASQQDLKEPLSVPSDSSTSYTWQKVLVSYIAPIIIVISVAGIGLILITVKRKRLRSSSEYPKKSGNSLFSKLQRKAVNDAASGESRQPSELWPRQHFPTESKERFPISLPPSLASSHVDQTVLFEAVTKFIEEKPQLKLEDQQVLRFLAQNQGAAFESEIRNHFQELPKTTIWRLIKRLEREECIEIRKAAGQNLIKLRFDDNKAT
jgi:tetratricopeptide (TPR) repeat protein